VINYILRRLLLMIPTLFGITLVVFFVMALSPGGIAAEVQAEAGEMRPEERQALIAYYNQRYGLDKPVFVQYLHWLNQISPIGVRRDMDGTTHGFGFKVPDLGESHLRHEKVVKVIAEALPQTLLLNLITIPLVYAIAITTGIYSAQYRGKIFDKFSGTTLLALWSIPTMWVGVMLLGFFASKDYNQFFPTGDIHNATAAREQFLPRWTAQGFSVGWVGDTLWHLALPVTCLVMAQLAFLSKLMRSSVLENITADFARTGRAKGLSESAILFRHVLRNSLLPLITVASSIIPSLLGGSLIVEKIFSIQGMGLLMLDATFQKDRELVMSQTLVVGFIGLVSLLIADVCYVIADPRVSYE
jgi:ABC-type dipeptide/oligopeptide/nickel transport system permease component